MYTAFIHEQLITQDVVYPLVLAVVSITLTSGVLRKYPQAVIPCKIWQSCRDPEWQNWDHSSEDYPKTEFKTVTASRRDQDPPSEVYPNHFSQQLAALSRVDHMHSTVKYDACVS